MSGKLDQSLDQIMEDRKSANPRAQRRRKVPGRGKPATTAPAGGIKKNTKATKPTAKVAVVGVPTSGDSKIIVSNLPEDVSETLIKDFFSKAVGHVKKVLLSYGPTGRSRGEATVTFNKPVSASDAHAQYNGVKVDGRPMKIEVVGGVVASVKAKTLQDRISGPKNAANDKSVNKNAAKSGNKTAAGKAVAGNSSKAGNKKKTGRAGRPKTKTAEELDAEMQDYFGGADATTTSVNAQTTTNGGAAPATTTNGGDAGMEDEVM